MDLNGLWNQLLLNATTVSLRPASATLIQVVSPYAASSDTNSSLSCEGPPEEERNDDDEEAAEVDADDKVQKRRSIQRIRYSKEEYRCEQCPYTCTTEKAFLRHSRGCEARVLDPAHYPLSCPVCGKDRRDEETLSLHMMKHKLDKHFCCDMCKFRSLQLKKLIQHRRMHTGEKPHLCPFCSYRSSRRDNLRSHVRRVHKKNDLPCDTFTPRSMVLAPRKP